MWMHLADSRRRASPASLHRPSATRVPSLFLSLVLLVLLVGHASGHATPRGLLVGYGIHMYEPSCAFACRDVLARRPLNCSVTHEGVNQGFHTAADCFAQDEAFLLSLAGCLHRQCLDRNEGAGGPSGWVIERFWEHDVIDGHAGVRLSLSKALHRFENNNSSRRVLKAGEPIDEPVEVDGAEVAVAEASMRDFAWVERQHSTFGLALMLLTIGLPPLLALASFFTFSISPRLERFILAHVVYPPIIRHDTERISILRLLGSPKTANPPTRGQAILVLLIVCFNVLFSTVGYRISWPNFFFAGPAAATLNALSNRVGVLAFANLPIIVLFASRNNPLVWLTGWSYGTFVMLHRWVAYVCLGQAALHSVIYVAMHLPVPTHPFTHLHWAVGALATASLGVLAVAAAFPLLRRRWYEVFIDTHLVLALGTLFAAWYHIYCKFGHQWGYENWIFLAGGIWVVERLIRAGRLAVNGTRRTAEVLEVDDEYMVVNVEGPKGTGMAYLYFPTAAGWRLWENHPFSVMASVVEKSTITMEKGLEQGEPVFGLIGSDSDSDSDAESEIGSEDESDICDSPKEDEKLAGKSMVLAPRRQRAEVEELGHPATAPAPMGTDEDSETPSGSRSTNMTAGLSFLVRREKGTTARLFTDSRRLPVLVEGPYPSHTSSAFVHLATAAPNVVCIAGGVGIAPVLPILRARSGPTSGRMRTSLYFGTRSEGLIRTCGLEEFVRNSRYSPDAGGSSVDISIRVGRRWALDEVVFREAGCDSAGAERRQAGDGGDVVVVVCGPPSMVQDVRWAVVEANRRRTKGVVRLVDECFSW